MSLLTPAVVVTYLLVGVVILTVFEVGYDGIPPQDTQFAIFLLWPLVVFLMILDKLGVV